MGLLAGLGHFRTPGTKQLSADHCDGSDGEGRLCTTVAIQAHVRNCIRLRDSGGGYGPVPVQEGSRVTAVQIAPSYARQARVPSDPGQCLGHFHNVGIGRPGGHRSRVGVLRRHGPDWLSRRNGSAPGATAAPSWSLVSGPRPRLKRDALSSEVSSPAGLPRRRDKGPLAASRRAGRGSGWCRGWDSNPHALRPRSLSPLRLPFRHPGRTANLNLIEPPTSACSPSRHS